MTDEERHVIDEFPFTFYGETFYLILASDRTLYVPLRDLCESLGIDSNAQSQRIRRNPAINDALVQLPVEVPHGDSVRTQRVNCLTLKRLPYWLGTIDATRISDEDRRNEVVRYQREFADVAWAAFRSQILPEDIRAEIDANLPEDQQQYFALMDEASELRRGIEQHERQLGEHDGRIEDLEKQVSGLRARFEGTDFLTKQQGRQYQRMVAALADLLEKKGQGSYHTVHGAVKNEFEVPSYKLIPEKDFPRLRQYLAQWYKRLVSAGTPLPDVFEEPDQRRLF